MMQAVYVAGACVLVVSLCANWWLWEHRSAKSDEPGIVDIFKSARDADKKSAEQLDQDVAKAKAKAEEKRDALKDTDTDSITIDELLRRCRAGLLKGTENSRPDSSSSSHGSMSTSGNATGSQSR